MLLHKDTLSLPPLLPPFHLLCSLLSPPPQPTKDKNNKEQELDGDLLLLNKQ